MQQSKAMLCFDDFVHKRLILTNDSDRRKERTGQRSFENILFVVVVDGELFEIVWLAFGLQLVADLGEFVLVLASFRLRFKLRW